MQLHQENFDILPCKIKFRAVFLRWFAISTALALLQGRHVRLSMCHPSCDCQHLVCPFFCRLISFQCLHLSNSYLLHMYVRTIDIHNVQVYRDQRSRSKMQYIFLPASVPFVILLALNDRGRFHSPSSCIETQKFQEY